MISRFGCSSRFSSQSSLIACFWLVVLTPLTLTPCIKTGNVVSLASAVVAIACNQLLLLSSSLLAFSIRVETRILLFRSLLVAITYTVILCGSWALMVITSVYIFFFFYSSLSFLSLSVIFSSLRFCSVFSSSLRSVALAV